LTVLLIFSWNLFIHSLVIFGYSSPEWISDIDTLAINESNPQVKTIRAVFLLVLFCIATPILIRQHPKLKLFNIVFLALLLCFMIGIIAQTPLYIEAYKKENIDFEYFQKPTPIWIESFFSILLAFYIQPFIFCLKRQLVSQPTRTIRRIGILTILFEIIFFVAIGALGYISLGDKYMPEVFILRKNYPNANAIYDAVYKIALICLLVCNTFGMFVFNQIMRDYILKYIWPSRSKLVSYFSSLLPFGIFFLLTFLKPSIVEWFSMTGMTICLFNGHIVPKMMKIRIFHMDTKSYLALLFTYFKLIMFALLGLAGIYFKFKLG